MGGGEGMMNRKEGTSERARKKVCVCVCGGGGGGERERAGSRLRKYLHRAEVLNKVARGSCTRSIFCSAR